MIKINKKKDIVAFIAPSSACMASSSGEKSARFDLEKSNKRLAGIVKLYKEQGFRCTYDKEIFAKNQLEYFAAPREQRLKQLRDAILNPDVKIIAAFRGGYGSGELVFDCMNITPPNSKILIGFSDITALHFLFNQKYGMKTIHGAMGVSRPEMIKQIFDVLDGKKSIFDVQSLNELAQNKDNISGEMAGGNLALICNMIGTKLHPVFKDKIIFVEDINEKSYQIHRSLLHMKNAGLFTDAAAVIFADFSDSDEYVQQTLNEFTREYLTHIPTYRTSGIGHGDINLPVVIGGLGNINKGKLEIASPFEMES